jgi:hypothetical protein
LRHQEQSNLVSVLSNSKESKLVVHVQTAWAIKRWGEKGKAGGVEGVKISKLSTLVCEELGNSTPEHGARARNTVLPHYSRPVTQR